MIVWEITNRGFMRGEFVDMNGDKCSVQESSLATEDAIWIGCDGYRMHLTRSKAKILIKALEGFVETGNLRKGRDYE